MIDYYAAVIIGSFTLAFITTFIVSGAYNAIHNRIPEISVPKLPKKEKPKLEPVPVDFIEVDFPNMEENQVEQDFANIGIMEPFEEDIDDGKPDPPDMIIKITRTDTMVARSNIV